MLQKVLNYKLQHQCLSVKTFSFLLKLPWAILLLSVYLKLRPGPLTVKLILNIGSVLPWTCKESNEEKATQWSTISLGELWKV